jgi:MFS transporter, UMF1 family
MADQRHQPPAAGASRRARLAWCLFDWANSGFPAVIVTFVFSAYYARAVAESITIGTVEWGRAMALSGVVIAVLSPVFGAIADRAGRQKPWLAAFGAICVIATAALWFTRPDPSYALWALVVFAVANTAFEITTVFYNAMLPGLARRGAIGRLSGWGWGFGYFGGLVCLAIALVVFVQPERAPFGLDREAAEHIRIVAPLVAVWFVVFALPLFLYTPDAPSAGITPARAVRDGLGNLIATLRRIAQYRNIMRFLLARLFYIDGLNTLFAFGGIYAAGSFGMDIAEIILFGIALNVTAGMGAIAFAWVDDWIGPKKTILIALLGLMALGVPLLLVETKTMFWALALPLGLFMGPAQAASRSMMARLAPTHMRAEMFGLFALSGRITAFLGPAVLAWATLEFNSQRAGMATVIAFLIVGFVLMLPVRESE